MKLTNIELNIKRLAALAATAMLSLSASIVMAQTPDKINFRLDWSIYGSHAPFYLALEKGLYAKEGLDVRIEEGQGSATVAKLVAQGNEQLGFVDFGSMVLGVKQGMPLKAVMRVISNVMSIFSHQEAPIKSPKELEGKTVAYVPAESTSQMFTALLAVQGVDFKKINTLTPAVGAKNALFLQRRIDAMPGNINVQVAQLEAQGAKVSYFMYSDFGIEIMNNGIVANSEFAAKHPDVVKRFLRATKAAFLAAAKNPEEAVDAIIKRMPQQARNRATLLRQLQLTAPYYTTSNTAGKPFGWMVDKDWAQLQDLLVNYGGMKGAVPINSLYTNEYLPE